MGVENQDTASPDVSEETLDDVVSPVEETGGDDAADSSPAPQKDEKSALSIVRDAVQQDETPESFAGKSDHQDDPKPAAVELDDEDFSDAPFHKHPRFREVIRQRNELRAPAESYRKIESFCAENAISNEEAANAFNLLALMKRDPEQAWAQLRPTVMDLLTTIGELLPSDLREQVSAGRMQADVAKALAKERAKATMATRQMGFREEQAAAQQRQREAEATAAKQQAVRAAAREWETSVRESDPDFARKEQRLRKEIVYLHRVEGVPDTPEGVKAQLRKAMKSVNDDLAATRPRRPTVQPVTGGSMSGNPRAKPKSVLEIVQNGGAR